jgi:tyrosyl-tRNA synthetase
MTLSEELSWRGFVNQTTYKDSKALDGKPITFYLGIDPSADSMTVGNLAVAMMVRHFIDYGHKAVLLVGGATGLIGDPDGKAEERELKSLEEIARNKAPIAKQYKQLFSGQSFELVDNYDWFKDIGYLAFLRDVGKHVPMRQMLGREFVQARLSEDGAGISYAEFSYSLIQGYDFLHLYKTKNVTLQVCGADQWGNCIAGVELIRRIAGAEAHIWSAPLVINKTTGVKFGKTEAGAVWLDERKTSVYQFYQFWLNADDEGVEDYLKLYTLLDKERINKALDAFHKDRSQRAAQKLLAYEVTKLVHGEKKASAVRRASDVLFGGEEFDKLGREEVQVLKAELPVVEASSNEGLSALIVSAGLAQSRSEANRLIAEGAVTINGKKPTTGQEPNFHHGDNLLKRGKNNFAIILWH